MVTALLAISLLGIINFAAGLVTPRVMFALSRDGIFPFRVMINTGGHTTTAVLRTALDSIMLEGGSAASTS